MLHRDECALRPIAEEDLALVRSWRNSERIRANMYTDHIISEAEHRAWFESPQRSRSSMHLIFELQNRPVGMVGFTDIDKRNGTSQWGFYLGEENLPRGSGFVLGVLGVEYGFMRLDLRKICGEAFSFNEASIRFHQRLGFLEEGRRSKHVLKNDAYQDILCFALFREEWLSQRQLLETHAFAAGTLPPA